MDKKILQKEVTIIGVCQSGLKHYKMIIHLSKESSELMGIVEPGTLWRFILDE